MIDNDGNGYVDCADFSCSMSMDSMILEYCAGVPTEDTPETCFDGMDNDENGFTDCDDFSCSMSENPEIVCPHEDTLELCRNGFDDDDNGSIDCQDFACYEITDPDSNATACQESLSDNASFLPDALCSDGEDNDNDGFVDCEDWDCSYDPLVTICEGPGLCEL
jgi:hypothetical protein